MKLPPGASGSRMTTTTSLVDAGSPVACSGGDTSRPSHVWTREIVAPGLKSLLTAIEPPDPDPPADVVVDLPDPPPQPATLTTTRTVRIAVAMRMLELWGESGELGGDRVDPTAAGARNCYGAETPAALRAGRALARAPADGAFGVAH